MASRLKRALIDDGRPAWKIAVAAELSPTVLSHLTTGRRAPLPEESAALARVLGCPESELFPVVNESQAA